MSDSRPSAVVVVEGSLRRHLVAALEGYVAGLRRNGVAAPASLWDLLEALRGVTAVQEGSQEQDARDGGLGDASAMQQVAFSYSAVAERLDVSESTVKRLVKAGELPVVSILGSRRIRSADLDAYLESLVTANKQVVA
jgi:excisionase family DNA binding protein